MPSLTIFLDLGKTICYPGMHSALREPGALRDVETVVRASGHAASRARLLHALLMTYREYAIDAERTLREWPALVLTSRVLERMGFSESEAGRAAHEIVSVYCNRLIEKSLLYPGAGEVIAALAYEGYPLALITDGVYDRDYTERLLSKLGIRTYFRSLTLSSEVGLRKPSPVIFTEACRAMGADPRQCVFVGDREANDVQGAIQSGMTAVLFSPGRRAVKSSARHVIHSWFELPGVIKAVERR